MRTLIFTILLAFTIQCQAAVESDLRAGIDPTGYSSLTAANLLQLVSNGTIGQTNKGAVIRSATTPDTVNNPRYTNFLWLDISAGLPGTLKQWGGSSWTAAAVGTGGILATNIANGAVGQAQLATNAVATLNIQNNAVDSTKIGALQILSTHIADGVVSNRHLADQTIQGSKLAFNTIQGTNILDNSVNGTKIVNQSITGAQLAPGAIGSVLLSSNIIYSTNIVAGAVNGTSITNLAVSTNHISTTGASANQVMQMDTTGSTIQWRTPIFSQGATILMGTLTTGIVGYTNTHGLGGTPSFISAVITNNSTDLNYAVGDVITLGTYEDGNAFGRNVTIAADATKVYVITSGVQLVVGDKQTGARSGVGSTKWGIRVTAYR